MRNPNRTTKREREAARRACPTICRTVGIAAAARLRRQGLTDDATAFDRMLLALDLPPGVLGDGAGMHWSDYRNYAKTEDGRVVYIDPAVYERQTQDLITQMAPALDARLDTELEGAGLDPADYAIGWGDLEPVTEVRADDPDLPEVMRPAVEAFVAGQGGELADYTVAYRPSQLDTDRAEFLILPKWEHGGILEDYAYQYGIDSTGPSIDLSVAPAGAPPFNTELFEEYRSMFTAERARFTELDTEGRSTDTVHDLPGPVTVTVEPAPDTEQARAICEQLRGAGTLHMPQLLGGDLDDAARERLRAAAADAIGDDAAAAATPSMIVGPARAVCIECGDEFDGTGEVCSAGCGYSLTGEYPAGVFEKDYSDYGSDDG